ncbi:hypothetical protein IFM89_018536, partial [Coptis chinensis]
MAMRHPKSIVLSGALSALVVMMACFSTCIGMGSLWLLACVPTFTEYIICYLLIYLILVYTTILYAFFGLRLLYIAWRSDSKASQKKEMEE